MLRHAAVRLPAGMWVIVRSLWYAGDSALILVIFGGRNSSCVRASPFPPQLKRTSTCFSSRLPGDSSTCWFLHAPCPTVGLKWTMKLWDSLTTCLILLSAVHASYLLRNRKQSTKRIGRATESPLELPPVQIRLSVSSPGISRAEADTANWKETLAGGGECKSSRVVCRECMKFHNSKLNSLSGLPGSFFLFPQQKTRLCA